jgi:hypothetical protein
MKTIKLSQILTIIATFGTIAVNALANILPLNGLNTGEISDRFEIFFVPAGYVFSIWSLIYIGLIAYTIYQALPGQANNPTLNKIAPFYWLTSVANVIWLFLWHYEVFAWTLPFMVLILVGLLIIYRNLNDSSGLIKWLVRLPFSIYLGWISVATIANASQLLYFLDWNGWGVGGSTWAVIMIAIASILGLLMAWLENDTAYGLVLIWAFVGITVSQAGASDVVLASWIGSALIAVSILGSIIRFKKVY